MTFLMFVWGRGALAKAKGGAKRKIKGKRESLPTGTSGVVILVSITVRVHLRTCTDYDKVALIPNGHLCCI